MKKRILALAFLSGLWAVVAVAQDADRDSIKMKIIATNPSTEETQDVMIRKTIPVGLSRREDILSVPPELEVQFDSKTSLFYIVSKEREVEIDGEKRKVRTIRLEPGEILSFFVELKDVWYVPDDDMNGIKEQAKIAMGLLEGSKYEKEAKKLADSIANNFKDIEDFQTDDSIEKKTYIAGYFNSTEKLKRARASIVEMERYIKLQRESVNILKDEDVEITPSKTATWLVIFIILVFLGILTGAFYFVWQRRAHLLEGPLSEAQRSAFPESAPSSEEEEE